jgi:hypothetical protein
MPSVFPLSGFDQVSLTDAGRVPVDLETLSWVDAPSFTRPNDTNAYAIGDLVANSTTAGSVVFPIFPVVTKQGGDGRIIAWRMTKTGTSATNANFNLHLFVATPTIATAGDNGAIATDVSALGKGYIGYLAMASMTAFADGCWGLGIPPAPLPALPFTAAITQLYGILAAGAAYTPTAQEVLQLTLLVGQK